MQKYKRNISYALILFGGILALYQQSLEKPNQYLLILGLAMLMIGIYSTSKRLASNSNPENQDENKNESV